MTIAELKAAVDEIARREKPDTPAVIFLWGGRAVEIGKVIPAAYTDGTRQILVHEK